MDDLEIEIRVALGLPKKSNRKNKAESKVVVSHEPKFVKEENSLGVKSDMKEGNKTFTSFPLIKQPDSSRQFLTGSPSRQTKDPKAKHNQILHSSKWIQLKSEKRLKESKFWPLREYDLADS